jgi:hypothetical protein
MKIDLRQFARSIREIFAGRTAPSAITDPLAVYSYVVGYRASTINESSLLHTLQVAELVRENPRMRVSYTPDVLARLARAERVAPQILAIAEAAQAREQYESTPEGRAAHFDAMRAKALTEFQTRGEPSQDELRRMTREDRILANLNRILIAEQIPPRGNEPTLPPRQSPYLATTGGALTPQARAAGIAAPR